MLNAWKNIAVLLDVPDESQRVGGVGDYAARLAHREGAHLIGIFSLSAIPFEHPADAFARGRDAVRSVIDRIQAEREQAAVAAGRLLAELSRRHGVVSELRVTGGSDTEDQAALSALHCDLMIVGHPRSKSLPDRWAPERLLYASGVPVVVVPDGLRTDAIGKHVLVAWNASREAKRAVSDAMPLIVNAEAVTVLVMDADKKPGRHGEQPGADLALYLARHGAKVDVVQASSTDRGVAEGIMSYGANHGVDLIVLGAYSHARTREWILGGVTRELLADVQTPLLISR